MNKFSGAPLLQCVYHRLNAQQSKDEIPSFVSMLPLSYYTKTRK